MIVFDTFCFASPLLVGAGWFKHNVMGRGLSKECFGIATVPFPERSIERNHKYRVTMVRNPCSWLSRYFISCKYGHNTTLHIDSELTTNCRPRVYPFTHCRISSIEQFIDDYLETFPGAITKLFDKYEADSVIRLEDLPHAFNSLVSCLCGQKVHNVQSPNKTNVYCNLIPKKTQAKIKDAEKDIYDRYNYY